MEGGGVGEVNKDKLSIAEPTLIASSGEDKRGGVSIENNDVGKSDGTENKISQVVPTACANTDLLIPLLAAGGGLPIMSPQQTNAVGLPIPIPANNASAVIGNLLTTAVLQSVLQSNMQQEQDALQQSLQQQQEMQLMQAQQAGNGVGPVLTQQSLITAQSAVPQPGMPGYQMVASAQQTLLSQQALLAQQALLSQHHAVTHNLIPPHLQGQSLPPSMDGSPGYQPALIPSGLLPNQTGVVTAAEKEDESMHLSSLIPPGPALTVQDRPHVTPVFNGVNPNYPGLRVVNTNPPIFCVDNFLTPFECTFLVNVAHDSFGPAPVVGKGSGEISPSRTSSTCYLAREDLPDYLRKVSLLTGKPIEHCELPQVGRYLPTQQYLQHFDAFDLSNDDGRRFAANGGQRTITVLTYLNDVACGGATRFPALNLDVQPRQGMCLVFFPSTVDGYLDKMALHAALPAVDPKYVSQVWIRQSTYSGQASKRLPQTLGVPFGQENAAFTSNGLVQASQMF